MLFLLGIEVTFGDDIDGALRFESRIGILPGPGLDLISHSMGAELPSVFRKWST